MIKTLKIIKHKYVCLSSLFLLITLTFQSASALEFDKQLASSFKNGVESYEAFKNKDALEFLVYSKMVPRVATCDIHRGNLNYSQEVRSFMCNINGLSNWVGKTMAVLILMGSQDIVTDSHAFDNVLFISHSDEPSWYLYIRLKKFVDEYGDVIDHILEQFPIQKIDAKTEL